MTKNEITAVIIGEDVDLDSPITKNATKGELAVLRDGMGLPMLVAEKYGDDALALDYEFQSFIVNLGDGKFVEGYYPYYTTEEWLDEANYGGFYFGDLMVKSGDDWYTAEWVNPAENAFEMVTFKKADNFDTALIESLTRAMDNYAAIRRINRAG